MSPNLPSVSWFRRLWWLALCVLVLNDHVLKQAGVLPGWLTGKVSDFAGLIVAPVLVAVVARARTTRARAAVFAIAVAPFVAIKLSADAARGMESAVGWFGVRWRIWADPTDLLALCVLPLTWAVARRWHADGEPEQVPERPPIRRPHQRVVVVLGAVACLATSQRGGPRYETSAYLINATPHPVEVRVFRASGPLDCASLSSVQTSAAGSAFEPATCVRLNPGHFLPLDRGWTDTQSPADAAAPPVNLPCDAVIIRAPDLPDTLLGWRDSPPVGVDDWEASPAGVPATLDPHAVYLERADARLFAAGSELIASAPAAVALPTLPTLDCADFPMTGVGVAR